MKKASQVFVLQLEIEYPDFQDDRFMNYFRIKENSFPARLAARKLKSKTIAMVIGHTIHLYGATRAEFLTDERWLRHELKHIEQYERYGLLGFLFRYILQTARYGYHNCPLEREARAAEKDPLICARFEKFQDNADATV